MVDLSPNRNFIIPHKATHSIFLFKPKTTEKTPFFHKTPDNLNIVENLQDIHRTNLFHQSQDDDILEDSLGKRQAINIDGEGNRIKTPDHSKTQVTQQRIPVSNKDGSQKGKHDKTYPSLPVQTTFPYQTNNDIKRKQIIVHHSINIVQPNSKEYSFHQNHDLPSAASTLSQGGGQNVNQKDFNHNNNNRDRLNLDYLEVEYVDQDINVDVTSPSSQILTLMHRIHPTYIPRSTTHKVPTTKTILNPLLDPNFQPIGSKSGKRWSVKKRENKIAQEQDGKNKNNVLKASNFPELPSLHPEKSNSDSIKSSLIFQFLPLFVAISFTYSFILN